MKCILWQSFSTSLRHTKVLIKVANHSVRFYQEMQMLEKKHYFLTFQISLKSFVESQKKSRHEYGHFSSFNFMIIIVIITFLAHQCIGIYLFPFF